MYVVGEGPSDTGVDYAAQLAEAKLVFDSAFPGLEFLPRVPNPEEILWVCLEF